MRLGVSQVHFHSFSTSGGCVPLGSAKNHALTKVRFPASWWPISSGSLTLSNSLCRQPKVGSLFATIPSRTNTNLSPSDPTWDIVGVIIWAEIELQLAVILSCTAAFKALAQHLFPDFMDGLASGSSRRKTTRAPVTGAGTYVLESHDRTGFRAGFRTVTCIEAGGGTATTKQQRGDSDSVDSREHIVEGAAAAAGWPPRMETTISVHSSKRNSADGAPVEKGSAAADQLFVT
jgi:hypothetical protein